MFYDIFKRLCNYSGMTPNGVCKELGFSNSMATYWKNSGSIPRIKALRLIADYFDVPIQVLLENEPFDLWFISHKNQNSDSIDLEYDIESSDEIEYESRFDDTAVQSESSRTYEVSIFKHDKFGELRTVEIDGEPWFVGRDICKAFGDTHPSRSLDRVDDDDKKVIPITDSIGRPQNAIFVNESGMYSLLFTMQPEKANLDDSTHAAPIETKLRIQKLREFKHWVTSEVLPSIRKTGSYSIADQTPSYAIEDPIARARAWADEMERSKKTIEAKSLQIAMQEQQIAELKPKADYTDEILKSVGTVNVSQIAKDYGMSAKALNAFLAEHGIQYRQNGQWLLYSKYQNCGYTKSQTIPITLSDGRPDSRMHTQWTAKGRLFINDLLKRNGILPLMERDNYVDVSVLQDYDFGDF